MVRLPDGCYEAGPEVPRRYHDLAASFDRPPGAAQVLRRLTEVTGLSAYLGLVRNGRVRVADLVEGPPRLSYDRGAGPVVADASRRLGS